MDKLPVSDRSRLRRMHHLGSFDRETILEILDAQPICSVGYVIDGKPYVTPILQWREGERVYGTAPRPAAHCGTACGMRCV